MKIFVLLLWEFQPGAKQTCLTVAANDSLGKGPHWIHIRFNHRPHYGAPDELLGTAETRIQQYRGLSDVKDFTRGCDFMVIEGEIHDIPSRLPWSVIQSGIPSEDSEESTLDVYRYPAPRLHIVLRGGTVAVSMLIAIICFVCGLYHAAVLTYAFILSLYGTRFAPGRPFHFLKRYNPRNILYVA